MIETFKFKRNIIGQNILSPVSSGVTIIYLLGLVLFVATFLYIYQYSINYSFLFTLLICVGYALFFKLKSLNDKLVIDGDVMYIHYGFKTKVVPISEIVAVYRDVRAVDLSTVDSTISDYQSRPVGYAIKLMKETVVVPGEILEESKFMHLLAELNGKIPAQISIDQNQVENSKKLVKKYTKNHEIIFFIVLILGILYFLYMYFSK